MDERLLSNSRRCWRSAICNLIACCIFATYFSCLLSSNIDAVAQNNQNASPLPDGIEHLDPKLSSQNKVANDDDLARANSLYAQGDYQKALDLYTSAIKANHQNAEAFNGRGAAYKALKQFAQAISDFSEAMRLDPTSAIYATNRGAVFKTQKSYDKAIADFNLALEINPNYAMAYYNRGNLFGEQKKLTQALSDLTHAIELEPQNAKALDSRGFAYSLEGRHNEAIADFNRVLAMNENAHECFNRRGLSHLSLGHIELALSDFDKALLLKPGDENYAKNRARAAASISTTSVASSPTEPPTSVPPYEPAVSNPPVTTGQVAAISRGIEIASTQIGISGGTLDIPGKLSMDFPSGALSATQKVAVFTAETTIPDGQFYFVELGSGQKTLNKPVTVRLFAPTGIQPSEVVAMQEVGAGLWSTLPFEYDSSTGELRAQVMHFSGLGWSKFYKWMVGTGAMTAGQILAFSGAAALGIVTLPASVGVGMTAAVIGTLAAGGAVISDPLNAVYQKWGLERYAEIDRFTIMWTEKGTNALPEAEANGLRGIVLTDKTTNSPVYWVMTNHQETIEDLKKNYPAYNVLTLPPSILSLAYELMTARYYYAKAGYNPRMGMTVLVHRNFKTNWGSQDAGEWDHDFLHINTKVLEHREQEEEGRRATVAHEYWHAITDQHGYDRSGYPWMEEAFATALENEVFPGVDTFLTLHNWPIVAPELRSGLVLPINGDAKRGYDLWPWAKYVIHAEGHQAVRDLLSAEVKGDHIAALFVGFIRSLLFREQALEDPIEQEPSLQDDKPALKLTTGWSDPKIATFPHMRHLKLGKYQLPDMLSQVRPLSFNLFFLDLNSDPNGYDTQEKADLIVRRSRPAKSEQVIALERVSTKKQTWSSLDESEGGKGSVLVPRAWLNEHAPGRDSIINIALIGEKKDIEPDTSENKHLLSYFLRPPSRVTVSWRKNAAGLIESADLKWEPASPAPGLNPEDCYGGFLLKVRVGSEEWESKLLPPNSNTQTVSITDIFPLNRPMPKDIAEQTTLGMAAQDAVVTNQLNKFVTSETTWQDRSQSRQEMTLLYCGSSSHSSGRHPPTEDFDCTRWQPLVAGWDERKLGITELGILRPCVYTPNSRNVANTTGTPVLPPWDDSAAPSTPKPQECWQNFTIYNTTLDFDANGRIDQMIIPSSQNVLGLQNLQGSIHVTGTVTKNAFILTVAYPDATLDDGSPVPSASMNFTYDRTKPPPPPAAATTKPLDIDMTILYPPGM